MHFPLLENEQKEGDEKTREMNFEVSEVIKD